MTGILAYGVKGSIRFNNILNIVNFLVWVFIIIAGLFYASGENWANDHGGFAPYGASGVRIMYITSYAAWNVNIDSMNMRWVVFKISQTETRNGLMDTAVTVFDMLDNRGFLKNDKLTVWKAGRLSNSSIIDCNIFVTVSEPLLNLNHLCIFINFRIIPNLRITPKISISENKELEMFPMVDQHKKSRHPFQNTDKAVRCRNLETFTRPNIAPCKTLKY